MLRSCLLAFPLLALGSGPAFAQQLSPKAVSQPVTVPVVVLDKKGKPVSGLGKGDLSLTDGSHAQTIAGLEPAAGQPVTLAIAVDTGASQSTALPAEQSASTAFFKDVLARPEDRGAVLHFDHEVELLQDLTAQGGKLARAVQELGPTSAPSGDNPPPRGAAQLYDALYLTAHDVLTGQTGRKVIVVIGNGQDRDSHITLHQAIEAAQKAHAVVYTVYFRGEEPKPEEENQGSTPGQNPRGGMGWPGRGGLGYPGGGYPGQNGGGGRRGGDEPRPSEPHEDGRKILQQIAGETGGNYFEAKKPDNFDPICKEIATELRMQYALTYTPSVAYDGFHHLTLTAKQKGLFAQTPAGFYMDSPDR